MYTSREYDIMLLEAQMENDKLIEEVGLEMLGERAKRMVTDAQRIRGDGGQSAAGAPPASPAGAGANPAYG